jgi:hypothetical protein
MEGILDTVSRVSISWRGGVPFKASAARVVVRVFAKESVPAVEAARAEEQHDGGKELASIRFAVQPRPFVLTEIIMPKIEPM